MTVAGYLIDTSALARVLLRQTTTEWDDRIGAGLVASCDITELKVLYSARSATDRTRLKTALDGRELRVRRGPGGQPRCRRARRAAQWRRRSVIWAS